MKWFKYILFSMALLGGDIAANAQDITVDDPWKDYPTKKDLYADYSHFTLGVNIGTPYFAGDFRSVSRGNHYRIGGLFGIQAGYQFNPIFGMRLSADYGFNSAGPQYYEKDFLLLPNGNTYYNAVSYTHLTLPTILRV